MKHRLLALTALAAMLCLETSLASAGFQRGSGFNQGDLLMEKYSIDCAEVDADPSTPVSNHLKLYCKDDSGTTKLYTKDSSGTVTALGGGSAAPVDADYLVGTSNATLSGEIVVGTTPGGELGGTWDSPTIDDGITIDGMTLTNGVSVAATTVLANNGTVSGRNLNFTNTTTTAATGTVGQMGFDTNAHATGRGAIQVNDGTANTFLVGVITTDPPSNGQVPTWNTGGFYDLQTPSSGIAGTLTNRANSYAPRALPGSTNTVQDSYFRLDDGGTAYVMTSALTGGGYIQMGPGSNNVIKGWNGKLYLGADTSTVYFGDVSDNIHTTRWNTASGNQTQMRSTTTNAFYIEQASSTSDGTVYFQTIGTGVMGINVEGEVAVGDTNTGGNAGTDVCIDANNKLCACGSCA